MTSDRTAHRPPATTRQLRNAARPGVADRVSQDTLSNLLPIGTAKVYGPYQWQPIRTESEWALDVLDGVMIDDTSPVPVYYKVYEALRNHLEDNIGTTLTPGTKLPTERTIATRLDIARSTLRQALARLEQDGLVHRRQGDGTYVAEPRVEHDMRFLHGFTAEFAARGQRVRSRVLSLKTVTATPRVRETLGVEAGAHSVIELRRVRSTDRTPLALETVWLSAARCGQLLQRDLADHSLYAALREIGIVPVSGSEYLTATVLDEYEASLLEQRAGLPAMLVERVTYDADGNCVEVVKSVLRADRFAIRTNLDLEVPAAAMSGEIDDQS